jgi:signal peptidase I
LLPTTLVKLLPTQPPEKFLKRIVGVPGDLLELKSDRLLINGKPPSEYLAALKPVDQLPYFSTARYLGSDESRFHVQAGQYFVLGDNPANSLDSRFHGPVPRRAIRGKVWLIVP